jgi:hypothetical protein
MIPTLSEVEAYTTDHSVDAADHWDGLADRWEVAHWQGPQPGPRDWLRRAPHSGQLVRLLPLILAFDRDDAALLTKRSGRAEPCNSPGLPGNRDGTQIGGSVDSILVQRDSRLSSWRQNGRRLATSGQVLDMADAMAGAAQFTRFQPPEPRLAL